MHILTPLNLVTVAQRNLEVRGWETNLAEAGYYSFKKVSYPKTDLSSTRRTIVPTNFPSLLLYMKQGSALDVFMPNLCR